MLVTLTIMCRGADFFGFFLRIAQFLKCINVCLAALGTCSACFLERFPSPVLSPPVPEAPWHTRRPCGGPAGPRRLWSPLPVWDLDGHVPLSHLSSLPCPLPSPRGRGAHHVSVGFFLASFSRAEDALPRGPLRHCRASISQVMSRSCPASVTCPECWHPLTTSYQPLWGPSGSWHGLIFD